MGVGCCSGAERDNETNIMVGGKEPETNQIIDNEPNDA